MTAPTPTEENAQPDPSVEKSRLELEKLRRDIALAAKQHDKADKEVQVLEQQMHDRRRWWLHPTSMLALAATVASLATVAVSVVQARSQNFYARAQEERLRAQILILENDSVRLTSEKSAAERRNTELETRQRKLDSEVKGLQLAHDALFAAKAKLKENVDRITRERAKQEALVLKAKDILRQIGAAGNANASFGGDLATIRALMEKPAELILSSREWADADNELRELIISGATFSSDQAMRDSLVVCGLRSDVTAGDGYLILARRGDRGVLHDVVECHVQDRVIDVRNRWEFSAFALCDSQLIHVRAGEDLLLADNYQEPYFVDVATAAMIRPESFPSSGGPSARSGDFRRVTPRSVMGMNQMEGPLAFAFYKLQAGHIPGPGSTMIIRP